MPFHTRVKAGGRVPALVTAYLLTAVEAGLIAGGLVAVGGWSLTTALSVSCVAALPLLPLQGWAFGTLRRRFARLRASDRPRPPAHEAAVGLGVVLGFLLTAPLALVAGALASGLMLAVSWAVELAGTPDLATALEARARDFGGLAALPRWVLVVGNLVVIGGWTLLAVAWASLWAWLRGRRLGPGLREGFAWRRPDRLHLVAAVAGGLTVGWLPGAVAESFAGSLGASGTGPVGGPSAALARFDAASGVDALGWHLGSALLVLLAPVAEELVFRGFLWSALERWVNRWIVLVVTTLLFALAHLDPVHAPAAVLVGLFLGWLRLVSGSVLPALVTHVVHDGLRATLALWAVGTPGVALFPERFAVSLGLLTAALALLAWTARPEPGYRFG